MNMPSPAWSWMSPAGPSLVSKGTPRSERDDRNLERHRQIRPPAVADPVEHLDGKVDLIAVPRSGAQTEAHGRRRPPPLAVIIPAELGINHGVKEIGRASGRERG